MFLFHANPAGCQIEEDFFCAFRDHARGDSRHHGHPAHSAGAGGLAGAILFLMPPIKMPALTQFTNGTGPVFEAPFVDTAFAWQIFRRLRRAVCER